ncbi:hypothetical protein T08_1114 [Trichinella sp. T8]|nr:hypothetical protein T08_1114 [Trichinella sp. T8]
MSEDIYDMRIKLFQYGEEKFLVEKGNTFMTLCSKQVNNKCLSCACVQDNNSVLHFELNKIIKTFETRKMIQKRMVYCKCSYLHRLRLIGFSNSSWDRFFDSIPPHSAINQTDAQNLPSLERWWLAAGGWF